ncbi:hypothetical protein C8R43DRAFT_989640, partial [Mycena crocata]
PIILPLTVPSILLIRAEDPQIFVQHERFCFGCVTSRGRRHPSQPCLQFPPARTRKGSVNRGSFNGKAMFSLLKAELSSSL